MDADGDFVVAWESRPGRQRLRRLRAPLRRGRGAAQRGTARQPDHDQRPGGPARRRFGRRGVPHHMGDRDAGRGHLRPLVRHRRQPGPGDRRDPDPSGRRRRPGRPGGRHGLERPLRGGLGGRRRRRGRRGRRLPHVHRRPRTRDGRGAGEHDQAATRRPHTAMDDAGRVAIVWEGEDAEDEGVVGRRFEHAGTPVTGEVRVNTTTDFDQNESGCGLRRGRRPRLRLGERRPGRRRVRRVRPALRPRPAATRGPVDRRSPGGRPSSTARPTAAPPTPDAAAPTRPRGAAERGQRHPHAGRQAVREAAAAAHRSPAPRSGGCRSSRSPCSSRGSASAFCAARTSGPRSRWPGSRSPAASRSG